MPKSWECRRDVDIVGLSLPVDWSSSGAKTEPCHLGSQALSTEADVHPAQDNR